MQTYKKIIEFLESNGMLPVNIVRIHKELKNSGIEMSRIRLSGYLEALSDLDMIAYVPVPPAKGYMSITGFWRMYGEKYSKMKKIMESENK
jgi:hypothetical protein